MFCHQPYAIANCIYENSKRAIDQLWGAFHISFTFMQINALHRAL
jgi:hypothetical protein